MEFASKFAMCLAPEIRLRFTPNVAGTQAWGRKGRGVVTGADTEASAVVLRATRSEKLGNKIRGTAWVDDVALFTLPALARTSQ